MNDGLNFKRISAEKMQRKLNKMIWVRADNRHGMDMILSHTHPGISPRSVVARTERGDTIFILQFYKRKEMPVREYAYNNDDQLPRQRREDHKIISSFLLVFFLLPLFLSHSAAFFHASTLTFYPFPLTRFSEYRKRITIYNLPIRCMFFAIKMAKESSISPDKLFHFFAVCVCCSTSARFISWCLSYYGYTIISFATII